MISDPLHYSKTPSDAWSNNNYAIQGEHVFHHVQLVDLQKEEIPKIKNGYAFLGFHCDVGIERNHGRTGATQGPAHARKALGTQTWHLGEAISLLDLGDVMVPDEDLEFAQTFLADLVKNAHDQQLISVIVGGGHEVAFGHFQGLKKAFPNKTIGIINFDAHFDMRETLPGNLGTSGSSFLQIANLANTQTPFRYLVLGIQAFANTPTLVATAKKYQATFIVADDIHNKKEQTLAELSRFINSCDLLYISLDLDVFASAVAPGVSSPQIFGLYPFHISPLLDLILETGKVIGFDIAELNPKFDVDSRTAKLCASFINQFLHVNHHYYKRSA